MRTKLKIVTTVTTPIARKVNELYCGLESAFGKSQESGGRFRVDAFGRNLASVTLMIFPYLIYLKNVTCCYLQCNLQIQCCDKLTLRHKILFPSFSTLDTTIDWLLWGGTGVSELLPKRAYCSFPDDCDVDHGMMVSTGTNS
jgi:hypothetical protein